MRSRRSRNNHRKKEHLYPNFLYRSLNFKNKRLVSQAEYDEEKAFYVGQNSIEGIHGFPQDIDVGIDFLYDSIYQGSNDSLLYYCQLLINENDFIDTDFEEAENLLDEYGNDSDPYICYLYGLIYRGYGNNRKALNYFKDSLNSENPDSYFNYAEMLFHGIGCRKNKDKAIKYFELAQSLGCKKSEKYLLEGTSKFNPDIGSTYNKSADLVFMIDGTDSMSQYIQLDDLSEFCYNLIQKLWDEFPKVFFRFGVVLYTDTAVTSCIENCDTEKVKFQPLTKIKGKIKSFLSDSCYSKGGFDGPEDWASGYKYLINKIEWDNNSEKIVIHIADAPAHGNSFIGTNFYKIPMFNKTNSKSANQYQYSNIQEIEETKLIKLIEKAASKGIMFCCLNLNKYATNSFNVAKDLYMKKNGTEFIIQNHFKELDYNTFEDFVCNSVFSCFNKARRMRRLIEKATNQNQQIKKLEDIKNKNQITIKRPEAGKNKNVKLLFTRKQSSSSSSDDLTHNNNKAAISDKMPADQIDIKNENSNEVNNKNDDQSDGDEKMKKERKQINDDAKEKCAHIVDDDDSNNEYEEEDDDNDVEDGDEDEEYDDNDAEDGDEDEEYDDNDVEDGDEDDEDDNSEIKTVCNKDINTNADKTQKECDDDDVDTNDASESDFD